MKEGNMWKGEECGGRARSLRIEPSTVRWYWPIQIQQVFYPIISHIPPFSARRLVLHKLSDSFLFCYAVLMGIDHSVSPFDHGFSAFNNAQRRRKHAEKTMSLLPFPVERWYVISCGLCTLPILLSQYMHSFIPVYYPLTLSHMQGHRCMLLNVPPWGRRMTESIEEGLWHITRCALCVYVSVYVCVCPVLWTNVCLSNPHSLISHSSFTLPVFFSWLASLIMDMFIDSRLLGLRRTPRSS